MSLIFQRSDGYKQETLQSAIRLANFKLIPLAINKDIRELNLTTRVIPLSETVIS